MRSLGQVLIQYDYCPYKKSPLGQRCEQRGDLVKTEGEDCNLQAKEKSLRRNQPCYHLDLRLSVFRMCESLSVSLRFFSDRDVFRTDAYYSFPQCVLAVIP